MSEPVKSETAAVTAGNTEAKLALPKRRWLRPILAVLGVLFVINCALMWLWSREPQAFDVRANLPSKAPGTATVSALIKLNSIMLDKTIAFRPVCCSTICRTLNLACCKLRVI
jgi:hypothetical protein